MKIKTESFTDSSLVRLLNRIVNSIVNFSNKIENIKGIRIELLVICVYVLCQALMIYFHEPWFDEAQAWDIARDASLKEILFEVPHYEGHPALWHLVLLPFAKLGLDFNISISLINMVFIVSTVVIILFKSPFPRVIRIMLPFTYFLFYQYGVISRPYSMMALAFVLLATTYKYRNKKPLKYVFCMFFLCATSAYGIVISGGLAIVWVFEIIKQIKIKDLFRDKRCLILIILLVYALFLISCIMPRNETSALAVVEQNFSWSIIARLIYMLIALPSDLFITNTFTYSYYFESFTAIELIFDSIVGLFIFSLIFVFGKRKKKFLTFAIPYWLFGIFGSVVYFSVHHIGIIFLFLLFWVWIYIEDETEGISVDFSKIIKNDVVKKLIVLFVTLGMCIPVVWSIVAYTIDVRYEYYFGEKEAQFLIDHDLVDNSTVFTWGITYDENDEIYDYHLKDIGKMVSLSPYDVLHNCANWPMEYSLYTYYHRTITEEEKEAILDSLLENTYPDVIFGEPRWDSLLIDREDAVLFDGIFTEHYALVYTTEVRKVWKMNADRSTPRIFVKRSLLEEKGLTEISLVKNRQKNME